MDFSKEKTENFLLCDTHVENLFISEYMGAAKGEWVKLYLLALMHAECRLPADNASLAAQLGLKKEDADACWAYWESQGLVSRVYPDPEDTGRYEVVFRSLREELFGGKSAAPAKKAKMPSLDDRQLSQLYRSIEEVTGRLLEAREPEEIAVWISEYGMDPQVILLGYRFSAENRKSSKYRYVGAILKDWRAKGLMTRAQVEEYLSENDRHYAMYRRVFKELGFRRAETEPEKLMMNMWFDEYGFSLDRVLEACKKTTGISNPNLNYINSVLMAWYREEHKSEEPVSKETLFTRVNAIYEQDRAENERKTAQNRERIFTELPEVAELNDRIKSAGYKLSRLMLTGNQPRVQELRKEIDGLYKERERLLVGSGYAANALDPIYTCSKCKDTGLLEDGSRCSCFAEKAARLGVKG